MRVRMNRLMLSLVVIVCAVTISNGVSAQNAVETHWNDPALIERMVKESPHILEVRTGAGDR